jgi:hypothetical protein
MGTKQAVQILNTFKWATDDDGEPTEADTDFDTLIQKFTEYFLPKRNVIHDRSMFNSRQQQDGESIEEFVRALNILVKHCEYKDPEEQVRDRLVIGLRDCRLREKLQLVADLTLEKAITMARQQEQIKEQMKEQRKQLENLDISESSSSTDRSQRGRGRGRSRGTAGGRGRGAAGGGRGHRRAGDESLSVQGCASKNCQKCGYDHGAKPCPAKGQKCRKCSGRNHFSRMCKAGRVYSVDEPDSNGDEYWLESATVDVKQDRRPWSVGLDFYGKTVTFKIDTGADVTVLKEADYRQLPRRPKLSESTIPYLNSPGGRVQVCGEFVAEVTRSEVTYRFRVVVVPTTAGANLLARSVSEAMGLVLRPEEAAVDGVFGSTGLLNTEPVKLELKENAKPYCVTTARRIPFPLQSKVKEELDKLERDGVIKKVTQPTDFCAPLVPVKKKNNKIRICVDFKKLNQSLKRPHLMLPNLEDIAPKLSGATVFSTLDVSQGFFQVPLHPDSALLTTFMTPYGHYCFQRVPMGINAGPEVFQAKMSETMSGLPGCEVIMDDVLIHGATKQEHDERLSQALRRIEMSGLKLNRDKCHFGKSEVTYFGHVINAKGINASPEKVEAITKLEAPKNVTELRRIVGMINYLGRFTKNLSTIMKPLTDLLKKNIQWCWDSPQQKALKTR